MGLSIRNIGELSDTFLQMLDQNLGEQEYQTFLEKNTPLIPREFVQNHGVHFDLVLRKLSLAQDYVTDFFYLAKSSADWNCVLVEIEKPSTRFFKPNTSDPHKDFLLALNQIKRWRAWFADTSNRDGFLDGTLKMIRIPPHMAVNPCHMKYVLVMGRRAEYENNPQRRALIYAYEEHDFHILSYDSLVESLHSKGELYVGVRKNDHIEVISDYFAGEELFVCMPSEQLRISEELRQDVLNNRAYWRYVRSPKRDMALDHALPKIRTLPTNRPSHQTL